MKFWLTRRTLYICTAILCSTFGGACNDDRGSDQNQDVHTTDVEDAETSSPGDTVPGGDTLEDTRDTGRPTLDVGIVSCDDEDHLAFNNSASTATVVGSRPLRESALYICPDTEDWFALTLGDGSRLTVEVTLSDDNAPLFLSLVDGAATSIDAPIDTVMLAGTEEPIRRTWDQLPVGDYFLVVSDEGLGGGYGIEVRLSCTSDQMCATDEQCSLLLGSCAERLDPICGDDPFEPNNSISEATPIDLSASGRAAFSGLRVCEEDDDTFQLNIVETSSVEISVAFELGNNLDIYAYDGSGRLIGAATEVDDNPEVLYLDHLASGTYYVVVTDVVTGLGLDVIYSMTVEVRASSCRDNADCRDAARRAVCEDSACVLFQLDEPSPPGGLCISGSDCEGDLGCYQGAPGLDDNMCTIQCNRSADCTMFESGYCLDIFQGGICMGRCTVDTDCPVLFSCDASNGVCGIDVCGVDADCAESQVCRRSDFQNIGVCTSVLPGTCADADAFEPNDTSSTATRLEGTGASARGATICDADQDWYVLEIAEDGTRLEVSVEYESDADLNLFLYTLAGRPLAAATASSNPIVLSGRYLPQGDVLVRVNQLPGERDTLTPYTLTTRQSAETCDDDATCWALSPLRVVCDTSRGYCAFRDGGGLVERGETCDIDTDCADRASGVFCWTFEPATERRNICTQGCTSDDDCARVPGTQCRRFRGGFSVCLP